MGEIGVLKGPKKKCRIIRVVVITVVGLTVLHCNTETDYQLYKGTNKLSLVNLRLCRELRYDIRVEIQNFYSFFFMPLLLLFRFLYF